jgi:hypothetical protein
MRACGSAPLHCRGLHIHIHVHTLLGDDGSSSVPVRHETSQAMHLYARLCLCSSCSTTRSSSLGLLPIVYLSQFFVPAWTTLKLHVYVSHLDSRPCLPYIYAKLATLFIVPSFICRDIIYGSPTSRSSPYITEVLARPNAHYTGQQVGGYNLPGPRV